MTFTTDLSGNAPPNAPNVDPLLGDVDQAMRPDDARTISAAFTASAGSSTALPLDVSTVRVVANQNCYYRQGSNPTATTADKYLAAGVVEYLDTAPGDKFSAIRASADGTLWITPMTKKVS